MHSLTGKLAVVLGASAEGGTGWGIAEGLAQRGARVVVGARSLAPLTKLADRIGGLAIRCDGGNFDEIQHFIDTAADAYGPIDIAVNSAATPTLSTIADVTPEIMQQAAQVNFFGMAYFLRHATARMRDGGSVVLISSMSATHPIEPHFAYAGAKSAMETMVKYAAVEFGPRQIRVNGIRIGTVYSDMAKDLYDAPGVKEVFCKEIPLGRFGTVEDMADTVSWLATSPYMTGCMLDVSGGNQLGRFPFLSELPGGDANYEGSGALADRESGKGYVAKGNNG